MKITTYLQFLTLLVLVGLATATVDSPEPKADMSYSVRT
jgi:hypothetical protein